LLTGHNPAFTDFLSDWCFVPGFILTGYHGLYILLTMASLKDKRRVSDGTQFECKF